MRMQQAIADDEQRSGRNADDAMPANRLTARSHTFVIEEEEERGPALTWVSLDIRRGLLVCPSLGLEVRQTLGTIGDSRMVRVMKERDKKDREGAVLCASSNRLTADIGRPGRECRECEERDACCFPRRRIAWQCGESRQVFAHTLCRAGTLNFTRYAARLKGEGLTPAQVTTRLFVEDARRQTAGSIRRHIQFENVRLGEEPFAGR